MEQKKLLLVAISVGLFIVIVIGAAILAFSPMADTAIAAAQPMPAGMSNPILPGQASQPAIVNVSDYIKDGVQGLKPAPEGAALTDNTFHIKEASGTAAAEGGKTVITVEPKTAAGVPDTAPAGKAFSAARPKAAPAKTSAAVLPKAPKSAPKAKTQPKAQPKIYDDYWVQAGSFSAISRAEDVKETLAQKGINAIIENRDLEGATYFRVRVGPYISQSEADYWLSLIKSIDGFEGSQVWQSRSKR
jgi:DedD protein